MKSTYTAAAVIGVTIGSIAAAAVVRIPVAGSSVAGNSATRISPQRDAGTGHPGSRLDVWYPSQHEVGPSTSVPWEMYPHANPWNARGAWHSAPGRPTAPATRNGK
jgi:hypothetical protein